MASFGTPTLGGRDRAFSRPMGLARAGLDHPIRRPSQAFVKTEKKTFDRVFFAWPGLCFRLRFFNLVGGITTK
jgi:hypothetical protein